MPHTFAHRCLTAGVTAAICATTYATGAALGAMTNHNPSPAVEPTHSVTSITIATSGSSGLDR